jgi:hypothetical protein
MLYPSSEYTRERMMWLHPTSTLVVPSQTLTHTAEEYNTLFEQEVLDTDYTTGFDQWQVWDRRKKRRMWNRGNTRSLLSDSDIDPAVQQHMVWVMTPKPPPPSSIKLMIPETALYSKQKSICDNSIDCLNDRLCRHHHHHHHHHHEHDYNEKEDKSVCSTRATEISDDSLLLNVPPGWMEDDHTTLSNDYLSDPTEKRTSLANKKDHRLSSTGDSGTTTPPPPLTVLSKDRVKRALARGDSLRVLECSGCKRHLFVTPDVPLVYCPVCACFSQLEQEHPAV